MKTVKSVTIETLPRGIAMIFTLKEGEPVTLHFQKNEARELGRRLFRMLGTTRGGEGVEVEM